MQAYEQLTEYLDTYMKNVVPKTAHESQIRGTKLAFLAGAAAMFSVMTNIDDEDEDKAVAEMKDLHDRTYRAAMDINSK